MLTRTAIDLGAAIRRARVDQRLTQAALAAKVGVTRAWLVSAEAGKPSLELGLVLRTLAALGLVIDVVAAPSAEAAAPAGGSPSLTPVDLDDVLRSLTGPDPAPSTTSDAATGRAPRSRRGRKRS